MTSTETYASTAVLTATLGLAAISWGAVVLLMHGMDAGVATSLGPFTSFMPMWILMMAAMMLPGMVPTVFRHVQVSGHAFSVLPFVGSYLTVWAFTGIPIYVLYRPHETLVAGLITIAAGLYEFSPLKKFCRQRCCENFHSGLECGLYCLGSCLGLMLMQVALGIMSVTWMLVITILIVAQKLLPAKTRIDVPLALTIIGLGILIAIAPTMVPDYLY